MTSTERQLTLHAAVHFDPSDLVELRPIDRRPPPPGEERRPSPQSWVRACELAEQADRLHAINRERFCIFFGANPRPWHGATGNECIRIARCAFADFDDTPPPQAIERLNASGLPRPTLLLNSGHGVHAYWRLALAMDDLALWSQVQRRIIALLKSDPRIHNAERIMRLSPFMNVKAEPFVPCDIIECRATERHELATITGILDAKGIPAEPNPKPERNVTPEQLKAAKARSAGKGDSVIDQFNQTYDIRAVLSAHGYTDAGGARMNRPGGTTEGVHIVDGLSFHFSSNDKLNDGKFGYFSYHNPFSAFCVLNHKGDVSKAVRAAACLMGIEHKNDKGESAAEMPDDIRGLEEWITSAA
jgi:hypothetical protein